MELSAIQLIGLLTLLIVALGVVVANLGKGETAAPAPPEAGTTAASNPTTAISFRHWLGLGLLITAAVLGAIAIDHYLLPPRPVEYRIVSLEDLSATDTLAKLGNDGWRVVSARRAINDDHGIYELIIMRE